MKPASPRRGFRGRLILRRPLRVPHRPARRPPSVAGGQTSTGQTTEGDRADGAERRQRLLRRRDAGPGVEVGNHDEKHRHVRDRRKGAATLSSRVYHTWPSADAAYGPGDPCNRAGKTCAALGCGAGDMVQHHAGPLRDRGPRQGLQLVARSGIGALQRL